MDPNNPYDFITNPAKPPKRPLFSGSGAPRSTKQRALLIAGLAGGLLIVGMIFWSILGALTGENFDDTFKVARTQQKILATTELGLKNSTNVVTRTRASTLRIAILSDSTTLKSYLTKQTSAKQVKQIGDGKDSEIEKDFENALKNNNFETVFNDTLDELLADYQDDIKSASSNAGGKNEKELMKDFLSDVDFFYQQKS